MKKFLLVFILGLTILTPQSALALDLGGGRVKKAAVEAGYDKATDDKSLAELIGTGIKAVLSFVGVIFLVLMVYAGYLWMTARGEESQIEKAQNIIRSSIIGLVVMVGAYSITNYVVPAILDKTTGDSGEEGGAGGGAEVLCCVFNQPDGTVIKRQGSCLDVQPICQRAEQHGGGLIELCTEQQLPQDQCQ